VRRVPPRINVGRFGSRMLRRGRVVIGPARGVGMALRLRLSRDAACGSRPRRGGPCPPYFPASALANRGVLLFSFSSARRTRRGAGDDNVAAPPAPGTVYQMC